MICSHHGLGVREFACPITPQKEKGQINMMLNLIDHRIKLTQTLCPWPALKVTALTRTWLDSLTCSVLESGTSETRHGPPFAQQIQKGKATMVRNFLQLCRHKSKGVSGTLEPGGQSTRFLIFKLKLKT